MYTYHILHHILTFLVHLVTLCTFCKIKIQIATEDKHFGMWLCWPYQERPNKQTNKLTYELFMLFPDAPQLGFTRFHTYLPVIIQINDYHNKDVNRHSYPDF